MTLEIGEILPAIAGLRDDNALLRDDIARLRNDLAVAEVRRLRRALDCWHTNNRTMTESADFKRSVINYYNRACTIDGTSGSVITASCMVSNSVFKYGELCPAHLVKHCKPELMHLYGLSPNDIDNPRNGILLLKEIEIAFDHKDVCFLYHPLRLTLIFQVLCPALLCKRIHPLSTSELRTFQDIDGAILQCPPSIYPFRRILSMHAKLSYSRAFHCGWIAESAELTDYFAISEATLTEPECMRGLTWKQVNYEEIETTVA